MRQQQLDASNVTSQSPIINDPHSSEIGSLEPTDKNSSCCNDSHLALASNAMMTTTTTMTLRANHHKYASSSGEALTAAERLANNPDIDTAMTQASRNPSPTSSTQAAAHSGNDSSLQQRDVVLSGARCQNESSDAYYVRLSREHSAQRRRAERAHVDLLHLVAVKLHLVSIAILGFLVLEVRTEPRQYRHPRLPRARGTYVTSSISPSSASSCSRYVRNLVNIATFGFLVRTRGTYY